MGVPPRRRQQDVAAGEAQQRRTLLLSERMFDARVGIMPDRPPSPELLSTMATRVAEDERLPRDLRLPLAHVLRESSAGLRRGQPLPMRLHAALGELLAGVEALDEPDPIDTP